MKLKDPIKVSRLVKDMPHLRKKMEKIDAERVQKLKEAHDTKQFRHVVDMWAVEKLKTKILQPKQRQAIMLLVDMERNYNDRFISQRLGIDKSTLRSWKTDPLFLRELDKEINRRMNYIRLHAMRNVNRAIRRGSMKDTWNYLKMIGDFKEVHEIVDRTGESELDDSQLNEEIDNLQFQLAHGPNPSSN